MQNFYMTTYIKNILKLYVVMSPHHYISILCTLISITYII